MTSQEWTTISVKVTKQQKQLIERICEKNGKSVNKLLSGMIERELKPMSDPSCFPENQGIPLIGENRFSYLPEKDQFIWKIDLGVHGSSILSEEVTPAYLKSLSSAVAEGIKQREDFNDKLNRGAVVPKKLIKLGVKRRC
ncbi:MAG: hypothetical protein AABX47_01470 [Nanoarchaeota archaeon]